MVHGPCGDLNPEVQSIKNNYCTKKYPFVFNDEINVSDAQSDGLLYRRRVMPGRTILRDNGRIRIDSRWIVPHNIFLASKCNTHINIEICNQFNYAKYVYKYIFKGHDRPQVHTGDSNGQQDEIKNFLDARYVSAAEAGWCPMHKECPACQKLDVHLPGDYLIYYHEDATPAEILSHAIPESTLTVCFKYKLNHPNDEEAQQTLYSNFCERYSFHKTRLVVDQVCLRALLTYRIP